MNYNLEIQKILLKVNKSNNAQDKINLLKRATNLADINNDAQWGVDLRLNILHNEIDTSACAESFPAFVWILNTFDNNPDLIDENDFLWEYKWMVDECIGNCNISLEQLDTIMNDYRLRLQRNGYSDHAYYNLMIFKHMFLYEFDKAREAVDLRDKTPHDRMSDNEAWEQNIKVLIALKENKFDEAIFLAQDILSKKLCCEGLLFSTLSSMSYYMTKGGDRRALEYCKKTEEEMDETKINSSFICNMAQVIFSLYVNGEREKAWSYFEESAHWIVGACEFLNFDYIAFILPMLKEKGERVLNVSPRLPYYCADNIYKTEDLFNYYYPIVEDLSKRYDERNKNNIFSERLAEHLNIQ